MAHKHVKYGPAGTYTQSTVGISDEEVHECLANMEKEFKDLTDSGVVKYQKKIFDVLGEGWVTTHGEEVQGNMAKSFNEFITKFVDCASDVGKAINDAAATTAEGIDPNDPYNRREINVSRSNFKSKGKRREGGYRFIFNDKVSSAQNAINAFESKVDKCCTDVIKSLDHVFGIVDQGESVKGACESMLEDAKSKAMTSLSRYSGRLTKTLSDTSKASEEARDNAAKKMNNQSNFTINYDI